ncbi:hypothetical protein HHI36_018045 [Cryptolaemus montrouzieri]|uniref:Uncharacterized protein n=1 Tax=Cryptolaemus montrouzieri TaxID=559131 RepID=A0ABD2NYT2_9CUCU
MKFHLLLIIFEIATCTAILTGNGQIHEEITSLPKYGCQWYGGSNAMVNCTCREDADEFYIRRGEIPIYDTWTMEINNCKKVIFGEHSIEDLRNLRYLHLRNIASLTLLKESLNWLGYSAHYQPDEEEEEDENIPSLKISMENCNIEKISEYTFKGRIKEIQIIDCHIQDLESFAFLSLRHTQSITLTNTAIGTVKPQAFKLFTTKQLILDNITTASLPSRTFSNVGVQENFRISSSKFDIINSGAFIIDGPKWFEVSNSEINTLDGEAFTVTVKGDVYIKNNNVSVVNPGAFVKVNPIKNLVTETALYLILDSNYFASMGRNSLDVKGVVLKVVDLKVNETCNCEGLMDRFQQYKESFSEIKCLDGEHYISFTEYKSAKCTILSGHSTMIIIIGVISFLLLVMVIILSLYYHKSFREGKYGKENEPTKNMSLIVPDGRTYRETEVHVILERADLLTTDL